MIVLIPAFAGALWFCMAVALFAVTLGLGLWAPALQRRKALNGRMPPVSAILPVKMLDPGFSETTASIFAQDYPLYEVLFGAAEQDSPALKEARKIAASHPDIDCRFLHSAAAFAVSPKLNTMAAPLAAAHYDFVLSKDSNIRLEPGTLFAFMENFTEGVGLVCGVPVAVSADNLAGEIEATLINGHARLLLSASALGLGFGVGKVMLFRRSDVARAGGLAALSGTLSEDTALCAAIEGLGLKTVFCHRSVAQVTGARSFAEIYARQLRWSVIRRKNEGFKYPLEPLASPLPAALAAALAAPLFAWPAAPAFALTLLVWFGLETSFAFLKGWEVSPLAPLAFLGREILALASWAHAFTTHDVVWADTRFDARKGALDHEGKETAGPNILKSDRF
ncbi:MAG TPA: glycosyltransferase [Methylocella sp.]|nr:glycosyltransferase [Methylocella sp.]